MNRVCSIFAQILELFRRREFEAAVQEHKAERHARGFSWGQFIGMLFCQLGNAKSLREICGGLAASEGKLRHLGVGSAGALDPSLRQRTPPLAVVPDRVPSIARQMPSAGEKREEEIPL